MRACVFFPLCGTGPLENEEIEILARVQGSGNIRFFLLIKKQGGERRKESTTELYTGVSGSGSYIILGSACFIGWERKVGNKMSALRWGQTSCTFTHPFK